MTLTEAIAFAAAGIAGLAIVVSIGANGIARKALRVQERALPPVWSAWDKGAASSYSITNQSSRAVCVLSLEPLPEGSLRRFATPKLPLRVEYGDRFKLQIGMGVLSELNPTAVQIGWRFEDDDELQFNDRLL
jgi:hypothetical protein